MDPWIILSAIFLSVQAVCPFVSDVNHPPYRYNKFINEHYDSLLVDYIIKNDHYSIEYDSFEEEFQYGECMDWATETRRELLDNLIRLDFRYFIPVLLSKGYTIQSNIIIKNQHIRTLYTSESINPILDKFFKVVVDSLWDDPMIKKSIDIVCEQDYDLKVYYKGKYSENRTTLVKNAVSQLFINCRAVMWANPNFTIDLRQFNNSISLKPVKLYNERTPPLNTHISSVPSIGEVLVDDLAELNVLASTNMVEKTVEEKPLLRADRMPEFPGGVEKMQKYIHTNIKYPKEAIDKNVQGRVTVQFVVSKTGMIENIQVIGKVYPSLDQEAIRIIKSMPRWIPGENEGKTVPVYFVVPVIFRLNE